MSDLRRLLLRWTIFYLGVLSEWECYSKFQSLTLCLDNSLDCILAQVQVIILVRRFLECLIYVGSS